MACRSTRLCRPPAARLPNSNLPNPDWKAASFDEEFQQRMYRSPRAASIRATPEARTREPFSSRMAALPEPAMEPGTVEGEPEQRYTERYSPNRVPRYSQPTTDPRFSYSQDTGVERYDGSGYDSMMSEYGSGLPDYGHRGSPSQFGGSPYRSAFARRY